MKKLISLLFSLCLLLIVGVVATSAHENPDSTTSIESSQLTYLGTYKVIPGKMHKVSPASLPKGIHQDYLYEQPEILLDHDGHYVKTAYSYYKEYTPSSGIGSMRSYGVK